ncbi:MAG TPA: type II toxin-antitoxin system ParD family antitoxin, partial [Isosphaeraceae bacterium]|nr:type II toxin-antitoxin system ParD family antitoxin [Isosphaeraceae bacterium]
SGSGRLICPASPESDHAHSYSFGEWAGTGTQGRPAGTPLRRLVGQFFARAAIVLEKTIGKRALMDVSLTPQLEQFIERKVRSGRYHSPSEVVQEALRLFEEKDRTREALRQELQVGDAEIERGEVLSSDEVFADLERQQQELEPRPRPA